MHRGGTGCTIRNNELCLLLTHGVSAERCSFSCYHCVVERSSREVEEWEAGGDGDDATRSRMRGTQWRWGEKKARESETRQGSETATWRFMKPDVIDH